MKALKTTLILCALSLFLQPSAAAQQNKTTTEITRQAGRIASKIIGWRHDFHQNPELGNREFRTAEIVAKHLQSLGLEVKTKVGVTGVVGILRGSKPGPVIALRADMDALPVEETNNLPYASKVKTTYNGKETSVMHACGHDGHTAMLMGVAEVLVAMKKELAGTVKFIFQPAEEGTPKGEEGGAELMIKEGVLQDPAPAVIFGLHLDAQLGVGQLSYHPGGTFAAVSDFKITVNGKPSHGSQPWNAIDPIFTAAQIVTSLQQIVSRNLKLTENAAVVTVGAINGGNRHNIIPTQVELLGTVRTFTHADESFVYKRLKEVAENTAEAAGATAVVEIPYSVHYPVTFNDLALTEKMLPSLQKAAGKNQVVLVPAITGSEDFSFYAQKIPGLFFRLGGMPNGTASGKAAPHHTPEFIIDDAAFQLGVVTLCQLVFDYGAGKAE